MRNLISLLVIFTLSCSHTEQQLEQQLSEQDCNATLKNADKIETVSRKAGGAARNLAAYSFITASYTAEVLWDATAGTVLFVGLCGPVIAASIASKASSGPLACIPVVPGMKHLFAPPLGRRAKENTKKFRCPNLDDLLASLTKVSQCYEKRGDRASLEKAAQSLEAIENSNDFYVCLEESDQLRISSELERLRQKIKTPGT